MHEKELKKFRLMMARAKVSLPTQMLLTPEEEALRIDVFWEALKGYRFEAVVSAFEEAYKALKWFPTPNHIIEFIHESDGRRFYERETVEANRQVEWMKPTEDGKQRAWELIQDLKERMKGDEAELNEKRKAKFETSRERLKKQARLVGG